MNHRFIFRSSLMLSRSLLSRLGSSQLRRSLVTQCAVRFDTEGDTVTIRREESGHKEDRDHRSERTHVRLASITGLVLGASALKVTEDDQEERKSSLLSRLAPRTLQAAEKIDDGKGDLTKIKPESRRTQFNFIADLVEETAPGLVYIEIKVSFVFLENFPLTKVLGWRHEGLLHGPAGHSQQRVGVHRGE